MSYKINFKIICPHVTKFEFSARNKETFVAFLKHLPSDKVEGSFHCWIRFPHNSDHNQYKLEILTIIVKRR